jgi:hypothetical protein
VANTHLFRRVALRQWEEESVAHGFDVDLRLVLVALDLVVLKQRESNIVVDQTVVGSILWT